MTKAKSSEKTTPLMKQYYSIKGKYPDALLLFRVGDFYETFGADAVKTSKILGIVLTRRANGSASYVELAGFPYHALDTYLPKLVKAGMRVAICDQLEDPKMAKKIVKRGVTEVVTPGISYSEKILEHTKNNFLAAIHFDKNSGGIAFLDISTGEFFLAEGSIEYLQKLTESFAPSEVVVQKNKLQNYQQVFGEDFYTTTFEDWVFTHEFAYELLIKQFDTQNLKGFGVEEYNNGVIAAGAVLHYLAETRHDKLKHIVKVSRIEEEHSVWLDKFTIRNLELFNANYQGAQTFSDVLDDTVTPMGSRLLKRWIGFPLKNIEPINERLDITAFFISENKLREETTEQIKSIGDLERLISKIAMARINPREMVHLGKSLEMIDQIKERFESSKMSFVQKIANQLNACQPIKERIQKELEEEPPVQVAKGGVFRAGISSELDEYRSLLKDGKNFLTKIKEREIERTSIPSLKVAYNNVFGYYIEVTNAHKDKVPDDWTRKQTLTSAERYITNELKEYEEKILKAEEKILAIETELYENIQLALIEYIKPIQINAHQLAKIDCLQSFARISIKNNYTRPHLHNGLSVEIYEGRHPVIEQMLPKNEPFIANDIFIDNEKQQLMIITGPNMSGKSAILRQTALIVIMAQIGCFVPAKNANIGLIDKIFTRVGASDNLALGESTFMVEMNETASILNNLSDRSLILLDEIGRGTSTYDGISIAWAIVEFLHNHPLYKAKTLFATHYHELNELAGKLPRVKNYNVSVKELNKKIIFLRKLKPGGSEHSFGIHVAKMAGIPNIVVERAEQILLQLEKSHTEEDAKRIKTKNQPGYQLSFIQLDDPLLEQIKTDILKTDINTLTPVEALMKLNEIKALLTKRKQK